MTKHGVPETTRAARDGRDREARWASALSSITPVMLAFAYPALAAAARQGRRMQVGDSRGIVELMMEARKKHGSSPLPVPPRPHPRTGADMTVYVFKHQDGTEVRATRSDFGRRFDINAGSLTDLLRRQPKSARGWRYIGPADDHSTG